MELDVMEELGAKAEIEALSAKVVAAAQKLGAQLRA